MNILIRAMSASSSCEEWTTVPEHFDVESEDENQHLDEVRNHFRICDAYADMGEGYGL